MARRHLVSAPQFVFDRIRHSVSTLAPPWNADRGKAVTGAIMLLGGGFAIAAYVGGVIWFLPIAIAIGVWMDCWATMESGDDDATNPCGTIVV